MANVQDAAQSHDKVILEKRRAYFSTMSTEKCSFKWTIECFGLTNAAVGSTKVSPLFPSETDEEKCKWILTFYPGGENQNNREYFGLKLTMKKGPGKEVMADFELRLRNSSDRELCYRRDDKKFSTDSSYTWEQLPKTEHLKKVLEDGILVINVNIISIVEEVNKYHDSEPPIAYLRMVDNYAELRKSGKLCDATIVVGSTKIPVHSVVLAARSPVFMAMFEHSTKEKQSSVVQIEDIDSKTMQYLLDFIYSCGLPEFDVPLAMNLLKAADKYDLLDLKEHCTNHLTMSLNTSNVVEILLLADMYSAKGLKEKAIEYICLNKSRFSGIESFNTILKEEARVLVDILHKMSVNP